MSITEKMGDVPQKKYIPEASFNDYHHYREMALELSGHKNALLYIEHRNKETGKVGSVTVSGTYEYDTIKNDYMPVWLLGKKVNGPLKGKRVKVDPIPDELQEKIKKILQEARHELRGVDFSFS